MGAFELRPTQLFYEVGHVPSHLKYYNLLSSFLFYVLYVITGYDQI